MQFMLVFRVTVVTVGLCKMQGRPGGGTFDRKLSARDTEDSSQEEIRG
jgi:hypothetical protein